nr:uncharacterized protein LOC110384667 [Helicoverpa armigera]
MILLILALIALVSAGPAIDKENYKDQYSGSGHGKHKGKHATSNHTSEYCTDPRTMRKHAAYTEWADAYSCTRHRCQPGGRNLAIYTVGCKRVEAPESAIECEEVVEDTNMQFPFCCTRLRCLVVVRGEVWTRVLGQPWEVLPAAPWSHMYKMKKPPPADSTFLPKTQDQGPVYELSESDSDAGAHEKVLRSGKKPVSDPDCNEIVPRAAQPPPDIVIALSTNNEVKEPSSSSSSHKKYEGGTRRSHIKSENSRHKRARKTSPSMPSPNFFEEEKDDKKPETPEMEETATEKSHFKKPKVAPEASILQLKHPVKTSKYLGTPESSLEALDVEEATPQEASEEKLFSSTFAATQKPPKSHNAHHQVAWTEIPQNQWNDQHEGLEMENKVSEPSYQQPEYPPQEAPQPKAPGINNLVPNEKPNNLQALVDAIGTRMRDIEHVVQKMSDKVHQVKPGLEGGSGEKRMSAEQEGPHNKHHKEGKRPSLEADSYKRFSMGSKQGSKYLHSSDFTTEPPLFIGDTNLNGYFSDASNSVLRRNNLPKEPPPTYMAPVENRRKAPVHIAVVSENSDDVDSKKKKKHGHKKRKNKSHSHKKHHKDEKRKRFNKLSSGEIEKNVVSLEDSSALAV